MQHRNEMMNFFFPESFDNFQQQRRHLQQVVTLEIKTPLKIQVNFDIPLFEGQIYIDALEKWVSILQGYFSIRYFSNREKITFTLLKVVTHVKDLWEAYSEQYATQEFEIFGAKPTWASFVNAFKEK